MSCHRCGATLHAGVRFCSSCGADQQAAPGAPKPARPSAPAPMPVQSGQRVAPMPVQSGQQVAPMPVQPAPAGGPVQISSGAQPQPTGQIVERGGRRYLLTIAPQAGWSCQRCGASGQELGYGRFRRVIGTLLVDFIKDEAGYFCPACRRSLFWSQTGQTLLLGWWGVLALLVRTPGAIISNIASLRGKPMIGPRDEARLLQI